MAYGGGGGYQGFGGGNKGGGGGFGGGGGGGGYMEHTSPSAAGGALSSQSPAGEKKARIPTITSLSLYQLKNAAPSREDLFSVDNKDLGQVIVIGVIRHVDVRATKHTYTLEDHTGTVEVVHWTEDDTAQSDIREGMYVRVVGHIKAHNNKNTLNAFKIHQIEDVNEITCHLLEVIYTHLNAVRGPIAADGGRAGPAGGFNGNPVSPSLRQMGQQGHQQQQQQRPPAASAYGQQQQQHQQAPNGLTHDQNTILECIKSSTSDSGMSIQEILDMLPKPQFNEALIRKVVDFLGNEGHVYSTIDDDHYKSTDS